MAVNITNESGTINENLRELYTQTIDSKAKYFIKYPEAIEKFWNKDLNEVAKNTGLEREIVERDVNNRIKEIFLNTQDTLLEDTKQKGDVGGRAAMSSGGNTPPPPPNNYTPKEMWKDFSGKVVEGYARPYSLPADLLAGATKDVPGVNKITGALADGVGALSDSVTAMFNPDNWFTGRSPDGREMELPRFTQDRQADFDENVKALEEESSRKANSTGGKIKRKLYDEGGELDQQMGMLMGTEQEQTMLPDEEMEEDYVEYVFDSTLNPQDKEYLENALAEDAKLSEIIDQVIESATEFSGSGLLEGPGSERSDSIPARLSDGEFVFTAKATEEIGADSLQRMMKDAEAAADERQGVAYGGMVEEEGDPKAVPIQTTGSQTAQRNVPNVVKPNRQVEEEMLKASPRRYYVPLSG